jgi:hypothetical protein
MKIRFSIIRFVQKDQLIRFKKLERNICFTHGDNIDDGRIWNNIGHRLQKSRIETSALRIRMCGHKIYMKNIIKNLMR